MNNTIYNLLDKNNLIPKLEALHETNSAFIIYKITNIFISNIKKPIIISRKKIMMNYIFSLHIKHIITILSIL